MSYRFLALSLLVVACLVSCGRGGDSSSLRGVPREQLRQMQEDILEGHEDAGSLSRREAARLELLQEQEKRLENPWVFGEWRERHGARLVFRDDGSVSVGAREGAYDEVGVYMFDQPTAAFESTWSVVYDEEGDPVILVARPSGGSFIYPFHRSRNSVSEFEGELPEPVGTGCYFTKQQN